MPMISACIILDAANMLYSFENEAASFGLQINTMSIINTSTTRQPRPNAIVLNGHPLEEVNQFTYLGSEICKDGGSNGDVDCSARRAKGAFGILPPIWRNSSFPNSYKVRIFKSSHFSKVNLLKMAVMQQIDVIIKRHKWGCIGHLPRKHKSSVVRQAMQWNPLDGIGRKQGRPC